MKSSIDDTRGQVSGGPPWPIKFAFIIGIWELGKLAAEWVLTTGLVSWATTPVATPIGVGFVAVVFVSLGVLLNHMWKNQRAGVKENPGGEG